MMKKVLCSVLLAGSMLTASAVDVNLYFDRKHSVAGVDTFQRSKFVTIHSANYESLKAGGHELMDYVINDLEVYYGRETGNLTGLSSSYPDNTVSECNDWRDGYASNMQAHGFESMQDDFVVSGQYGVYGSFVGAAGGNVAQAGTDYGDFLSIYLRDACGTGGTAGMPAPEYLEILNEPLWYPIDQYILWLGGGPNQSEEIEILNEHFLFHREAAREVHRQWSNAKIGGFAEAFPDPELRNYFNWDTRWKTFIDSCGADMDFYSFHLYDFHCHGNTKKYRKGGNMEALMDMITHYNYLVFGNEKPFVITEYGARAHCEEDFNYNPYRDWLCASSINSMMVQFMDRPDMIGKTIPFIMAVWSQNWNIFRPDMGNAVFTDYIKMYELWDNVKGTRLYTRTTDLDVQVDAYSNGNKTYLILNNIDDNSVTVNVSEMGIAEADITETKAKHFYWNGSAVRLDTLTYSSAPTELTINGMATMIVEYTTVNAPAIDNMAAETRNYATEYHKEIEAGTPLSFTISGLSLVEHGQATLRLGIGRNHGQSLQPAVSINGTQLTVPVDYRGDNQSQRDSFFGMLEIDVPYSVLQEENTISIEFADAGGYVNSVALRVFNMDGDEIVSTEPHVELASKDAVSIYPNPASTILNIDIAADVNTTYSIITTSGQVVIRNTLSDNTIDVSMLQKGIYILKLETDDRVWVQRFMKAE